MKKSIIWLCLLVTLPMVAQKKTFTAACLNVDGLPPTVKAAGVVDVKLNPEGPQETGTIQMSKLVSQKGWDFFGVSENFNYNTQLMSEIGSYYSCGTYRGSIPSSVTNVIPYLNGTKWFETDGLNLLWRSNISVSDEAWYLWNKRNGITSDGSDQLIAKGFRYYTVRVGTGLDLDVYILHMDAETTAADNEAREIQMSQLVNMILASDNHRPIIIMGDTNCRYTRDRIKELMFDPINNDPRFEIHDPWIDFPRKGVMPSLGDPSIMVPGHFDGTNHEAFQTGEVVDKIFYINNTDARGVTLTAKSYLHDTEFTWPDGSEISDHYPIVIEFEIENTSNALSAGEYYFRNVSTGKFLQIGGIWDTQAVLYETGRPIVLKDGASEGSFALGTNLGDGRLSVEENYNMFTDAADSETRAQVEWNFVKNDEGKYTVTCNRNGENLAMTANNGVVTAQPLNSNDLNQQWEIFTKEDLRNKMLLATEDSPVDATFLMKGYRFGRNDTKENSAWIIWKQNNSNSKLILEDNGKDENYSMYKLYNTYRIGSSNGSSITQTVTNMPNGKYMVSCDFAQGNNDGVVTANGITIPVNENTRNDSWGEASVETVGKEFSTGKYRISHTLDVTNGSIELKVNKSGTTQRTAVFVDNFQLTYLGPTNEDLAVLNRVKNAINDAQAKADAMGLTSYNNRSVVDAYENRMITGDGTKEVHNTYIALAKAAIKQITIPADMRYAILNNSFELGDLSEWDASNATNARVETSATDADGHYMFLADGGSLKHTFEVTMPTGIYELKALLSPGAVLTAGESTSQPANGSAGSLSEVTLKFIIQNGTETIGAKCDGAFTADNFTLTRVGNQQNAESYELVMLAMKDATARVNAMGEPYNNDWDLSSYQTMIDNLSIEGDGTKEFYEIYGLLREKVYSQTHTDGVSYTNAIINPSFEFGNTIGWEATFAGDTGVKENSNSTYTMSGCDGDYLFNTWQDGRGTVLSQTIPGLPAGHYRLRATVAADQGSYIYLEANGQKEAIHIERAKENGQVVSFDFDVAENTDEVTISIRGGNSDGSYSYMGGNWYKADKFELTRHGDQKVCFFYDRLQTAITRTNQIAYTLPEKYRNQWDPSDYRDLYQKHIDSGHASDPMEGSNGLAEIEELYSRLRALVFSQTESGADMSGAITNQSFELGDMTSWNLNMNPSVEIKVTEGNQEDVYKTEGTDGTYLINSYLNGKSAPLYQTLKGVPTGLYRLTAKVASDAGNRFYLAVNGTPGKMLTTTGAGKFDIASVEFEVKDNNTDVLLGLYPSVDGNFDPDLTPLNQGPWFKADDFKLTLLGRNLDIEWSMENDTYGTIILPFEANVPDGLEIYSVKTSTPTDIKSETYYYHILSLEKKEDNIISANTPYLVKCTAPASRAATSDKNQAHTFSGVTTHTADTYTDGMLTGSMVETPATGIHYHLGIKEGNPGFLIHNDLVEHPAVAPYHAYLSGVNDENIVLSLYFDTPQLPVNWTMEGNDYGTIILPFEADIPEGLEAYTIDGLSEKNLFIPEGEIDDIQYQVVELVKAEKIEANTPYLVKKPDTHVNVAEEESSLPTHSFKGVPTNTENVYTSGLLTGTFISSDAQQGDYILMQNETGSAFTLLDNSVADAVSANHAYIAADGTSDNAPLLLFDVPENGDITTGIREIFDDGNAIVDVYTVNGIQLRSGIKVSEALKELTAGFYILRNGNTSVKVLKQ
ncbi:hypothetical protein [uncultured Muribaculum sp.]|uniref:hypothetical protein n=1 Tax=uncultured Muribaculum sp. TaxID=1918613 RepID=UPI00266EE399|nr:hypothetical protein [uncultured Muribaculum sp.]